MRDSERREGDLLRRLELEETNRGRADTRVIRLLGELENEETRRVDEERKRTDAEERHRKLVVEFCKLGEEYAALQVL